MRRVRAKLVSVFCGWVALAGCTGSPPLESILVANFIRPANRQLAPSDKSDISAPGFPVDVEVEGQDTSGRSIVLQDARLEVRLPGSDWTSGPDPQLNGARALFPRTALAAGTNGLRVTVTETPSLRKATNTIDVIVPTGTGCVIAITAPPTNPFTFNISTNEGPPPGLHYTLRGTSNNCPGVPVTLSKGSGSLTQIGSGTLSATGAFAVPFTLADGEQTRLTAQMTDPFPPNPATSAFVDVTVKITPPALTNVSPSNATLFYVADSNIHLLPPPTPGYIKNKAPTDTTTWADFSYTVANAAGGTARVVYNGTDIASPVAITSDPQAVAWTNAALPPKSSGSLQFRSTDSAGNETIQSASVTIDVIPPTPSSFVSAALAPDGGRTATVNLQWTATGDDGDGGTPAGYDLRWSTNVVIRPDGGYFDPNMFTQTPGGIVSPSMTSMQLTPLPPLNTYLFQVRGFDAIGNYARQSPQSSVANFWTTAVLNNPDTGSPQLNGYGLHLAAADLNGDGIDDLVVAAPCLAPASCSTTRTGSVYVYYGGGSFPSTRQELTPADGQIRFFGADVATGNASHLPPDTIRTDLLVGQPSWHFGTSQAGRGRAFLFFGHAGTIDATTAIEFRGTGPGTQFGAAARIIDDINGDGMGEILISAPFENSFAGRVYLFYGRTLAAWQAARVADATDPMMPLVIPTSAADRIFTPFSGDTYFGRLDGYANLGNLGGTAGVSFTVPNSLDTVNKLYLHSGNTVNGRGDGGIITSGDAIQTLTRPTGSPAMDFGGFGARAIGKINLIQGVANDLVVTHPREAKVYLFPDGTSTGFTSPPFLINGSAGSTIGASLAYGDLNRDGTIDLVAGENQDANSSVWVFYNHGVMGGGFDTTAGAGFGQSRLSSPYGLGVDAVIGDFNGDGKPDLAAGDNLDGSGKVTVWY